MDEFFADLARVYNEEFKAMAALGCTYLQIDDTNFAFLCDPALREGVRRMGEDPNELPHRYTKLVNDSIKGLRPAMTVCVHLCRGNHESSWVAEGGYEPVADALFNELAVDGFFLEYDSPRAGDFAPLKYLAPGKIAYLGLVSTKKPELESKDDLKRRLDDAARHADMGQLGLCPQCGFGSSAMSKFNVLDNPMTLDIEMTKLGRIVEVSREVWG
jgi:5-methyltetrahydropteroyltriglutamate--homocysteine methyltransferase